MKNRPDDPGLLPDEREIAPGLSRARFLLVWIAVGSALVVLWAASAIVVKSVFLT